MVRPIRPTQATTSTVLRPPADELADVEVLAPLAGDGPHEVVDGDGRARRARCAPTIHRPAGQSRIVSTCSAQPLAVLACSGRRCRA